MGFGAEPGWGWGCSPCMSQAWLGTQAELGTCSVQHFLDQKGGKLLRNGQKGLADHGHFLTSGS